MIQDKKQAFQTHDCSVATRLRYKGSMKRSSTWDTFCNFYWSAIPLVENSNGTQKPGNGHHADDS